jgi:signal transduction histidine kinase
MSTVLNKLWPQSLFARLLWVWLMGLALVLAAAAWLALDERVVRGQVVFHAKVTQELAASADWLDSLSPEQRASWVSEAQQRRARWRFEPPDGWSDSATPLPPYLRTFARYLKEEVPQRQAQVQHLMSVRDRDDDDEAHHGQRSRAQTWVSLRLADGSAAYARLPARWPSAGATGLHTQGGNTPWGLVALTVLVGLALLTWLAVVYATRPLKRMTQAALDLAAHPNRAPLPDSGPTEVRQAAQAFNHMQAQLQRHMAQQTQVLAAIAHDLQTPLTRLRLKTEWVSDEALRQRMQADLSEMQDLVQDGLALARSWHAQPQRHPVYLNQLLQTQLSEWEDLGWAVQVQGADSDCLVNTDVAALRRVLGNVVHNAITYGHRATVTLFCQDPDQPEHWGLVVEDEGPGLPESDLQTVLQPFVRQESSRNRQTGGTGLGLSIALNLMTALGGGLVLSNRAQGGLRVTLSAPR